MANSLAEAVSNKSCDFLDENATLVGLARQKLFMITKPGEHYIFIYLICVCSLEYENYLNSIMCWYWVNNTKYSTFLRKPECFPGNAF